MQAKAFFRRSLIALWQAHIVPKIRNIIKYMTEANDGNIIPPTNNITAMKYGMMLSHVDESGDALMCCGVC